MRIRMMVSWVALCAVLAWPAVLRAQDPPPEPEPPEPVAEERPDRWSGELGLALNSSGGNERLTVLTTDLGLTHLETTSYELSFRGRLRYGRSEGTEVARSVRGTLNADFGPGRSWSPFVFGSGEHDRFRRLDLRLNTGAGVKRTFWREGWSEASLSGAVLYEYEQLAVPDTVDTAVTHLARWSWRGRARHRIREGTRIEQVVFYQPVWDRPADYLLEARTSARLALSERLAMTAGVVYQRDSTPPEDVAPSDWSIAVGASIATGW